MKKKFFCIPLLAGLLLTGCAEKYKDTTLYQRNGRTKPIVAVLPVVDNREKDLSYYQDRGITWDISDELTDGIRKKVADSPKLYLLKDKGTVDVANQLICNNCKEMAQRFSQSSPAEFIVVTELVNQEEIPFDAKQSKLPPKGQIAEVLNIDFRVKVFDMRDKQPKLILQEVIHNSHLIARPEAHFDYEGTEYGSPYYSRTPMGLAHSKLIREVTGRIENYIRASKG